MTTTDSLALDNTKFDLEVCRFKYENGVLTIGDADGKLILSGFDEGQYIMTAAELIMDVHWPVPCFRFRMRQAM